MPGTKKAVLVGINYTNDNLNRLHGCANDIKKMRTLIMKNGYTKGNIQMLSDDIAGALPPTKSNIVTALNNLIINAKPGDDLIFHYSGHGTQTVDRNHDEADHKDEAIYTYDKKLITDDEFKDMIEKLPVGATLTMIMDCCHSGSVVDLLENLDPSESGDPVDLAHGYVMMISGCLDPQTSADASYKGKPQGALTASILVSVEQRGFNTFMTICKSGSREMLTGLRNGMCDWLKENNYDQIPNFAYEGTNTRAPVIHGYVVANSEYHLRKTPARQQRVETAKADGEEAVYTEVAKRTPMRVS